MSSKNGKTETKPAEKKPQKKPVKIKPAKEKVLTENDLLKYEIAEELGLMDKVTTAGWKSLTSRESGRIGGILARKLKERKLERS
jgi:hypothetical protein